MVSVRPSNGKYSVVLSLNSLAGSFPDCESRWCRFAGSFPASKRRLDVFGSYL